MQPQERWLDFCGEIFYIGVDIHKRKWVVRLNSRPENALFQSGKVMGAAQFRAGGLFAAVML